MYCYFSFVFMYCTACITQKLQYFLQYLFAYNKDVYSVYHGDTGDSREKDDTHWK